MRLPIRAVLACAAMWAILAYGAAGHGVPKVASHDGMAGATVGLCMLLVTVVALTGVQPPHAPLLRTTTLAHRTIKLLEVGPRIDARARASPSVLQRFRN
jgi:hypothetical protein